MSKGILGTFYFKLTSSNNLLGEFTNNKSQEIMTETANPIGPTTSFIGSYNSVWFDIDLQRAVLDISFENLKYKLKWTEINNLDYEGEGMLVDNILIGYYKSK